MNKSLFVPVVADGAFVLQSRGCARAFHPDHTMNHRTIFLCICRHADERLLYSRLRPNDDIDGGGDGNGDGIISSTARGLFTTSATRW